MSSCNARSQPGPVAAPRYTPVVVSGVQRCAPASCAPDATGKQWQRSSSARPASTRRRNVSAAVASLRACRFENHVNSLQSRSVGSCYTAVRVSMGEACVAED